MSRGEQCIKSERCLKKLFRLFSGLVRITSQHTLVEQVSGGQWGTVAQHDFKKLEAFYIPAQHHQANRQRRGQDQTNRPPKRGGCHDRDRRKAGAVPVHERLDEKR